MHSVAKAIDTGDAEKPDGGWQLPLVRLELAFRCLDVCWLPPARGALWRSALGPQLNRIEDMAIQDSAAQSLRQSWQGAREQASVPLPPSLYNWLYKNDLDHALALPAIGKAVSPLVIDCPSAREWQFIPPGHTLRLQLALPGRLAHAWQPIVRAFANAANCGVGKAISLDGRRGRMELVSAHEVWLEGGERERPVYSADQGFHANNIEGFVAVVPPACCVEVHLASPLRLERDRKILKAHEFRPGDLVSALARRAGALMATETGRRVELDFRQLKRQWEALKAVSRRLSDMQLQRWSSNQNKELPIDGITGTFAVDLTGQQELFDLLWLGQWLGAGKGTMMGLGAMRLSPV